MDNIFNEIIIQRNNFARMNYGEYPNAIIISVKLFSDLEKEILGINSQYSSSDSAKINGMKVYRSFDIEGFKVVKINPDFPS